MLAVCAFWLGACPLSVWLGLKFLGRDIRNYGDGNPGAINVFRAGGRRAGALALLLDVAKGVPFVLLAHSLFHLPESAITLVALSAILGHAFSPLLRLKGGKAIAITFGVLSALPQKDTLLAFAFIMFLGFLFIEIDAWIVMLGPTGTLAYLALSGGSSWELIFMSCVLILFTIKQFEDLKTVPRFRGKLIHWLLSKRRVT